MQQTNSIRNRPIFKYLLVQTFFMAVALNGWNAIYTNFAKEVVLLNGEQIGFIQSVRELPGLLSVSLLLVLLLVKEMRLMSLSIMLVGIGTVAAGYMSYYHGVLICTLVMSLGFHYAESISQSLTLQHYSTTESPLIIGALRSATSAGSFGVGLVMFLLADLVPYHGLFLVMGVGCFLAGVWGVLQKDIPPRNNTPQRKMVLKKDYLLFYILTLLSGARRQIFVVFSVLLLVERFGFSLREMTFLFLLNHLINWILNRYIGKTINAFGERKLLTVKYALLAAVFVAYAFSDNRLLVASLYVLEQLFFNLTVAIRTFFQKIADPRDIAPTMAVGVTMNHVAAVAVPTIGGILWMFDYRLPFFMGLGFALAALVCVQFMDKQLAKMTQPAA
ncbi:MFS transporter [Desulfovibrio sp. OttesenSCG-928-C06]|nr:MFS transporter [Desulfovibrio sp. OttesenSCG-928-C06]